MGIVDAFSAEDRVSVKFSDFYRLMKRAAETETKEEVIRKITEIVKNDADAVQIIGKLVSEIKGK